MLLLLQVTRDLNLSRMERVMGMQVVVLAGGLGTRMRPWTNTIPKPLLPLLDRTLVEQVVSAVPERMVDQVIIAAGYRVEQMRSHFAKADLDYDVVIVPEEEPLGTGGALKNCSEHISGRFVCFNGDVISSLNVEEMALQHAEHAVIGTLALWQVEEPTRFGIVGLDEDRQITRFKEKPKPEEVFSNLINAGSYLLEEEILELMPEGRFSLEREVFPRLAEAGQLSGFPFEGHFIDAGTPESWLQAVTAVIDKGCFDSGVLSSGSWFAESGSVKEVVGDHNMFSRDVSLVSGSEISNSSVLDGAEVGEGCRIERCLIGKKARIGDDCNLSEVLVDHGAVIPAGTVQQGGIYPASIQA